MLQAEKVTNDSPEVLGPDTDGSAFNKASPWRDKAGIASYYGVCERTITNLVAKRQIPFKKLGRCIRFNIHTCDKAFENSCVKSVGQF